MCKTVGIWQEAQQEGTAGLPPPAKARPAERSGVWTGPMAPRARGQRTLHDLVQRPGTGPCPPKSPCTSEGKGGAAAEAAKRGDPDSRPIWRGRRWVTHTGESNRGLYSVSTMKSSELYKDTVCARPSMFGQDTVELSDKIPWNDPKREEKTPTPEEHIEHEVRCAVSTNTTVTLVLVVWSHLPWNC